MHRFANVILSLLAASWVVPAQAQAAPAFPLVADVEYCLLGSGGSYGYFYNCHARVWTLHGDGTYEDSRYLGFGSGVWTLYPGLGSEGAVALEYSVFGVTERFEGYISGTCASGSVPSSATYYGYYVGYGAYYGPGDSFTACLRL